MNQKAIKTILFIGTLAGITMHIANRIAYSRSTFHELLASSENRYYEWRFGKVRYTKKGTGSPLLLIHDLTVGSSIEEFHNIVEKLSYKNEVYCLDLLGYGLSDKPDMTFTNYLYVQLVNDFIKNVIGRKTTIIATGDAFPIAVMVCHNDNNIVKNLIAINPQDLYCMNQIPGKRTRLMKFLLETPVIGTFLYNIYTRKDAFTKLFREKYFYDPYSVEEKDVEAYVEAAHTPDFHSKHAMASYVGRYMNANIVHALKEIDNSIYIIAGEEKENNKTIVENYIYYNNAIESFYISKTKQLPHLEQPEKVLTCLEVLL